MLNNLPVRVFLTPVLGALLLAAGAAHGNALPGTPGTVDAAKYLAWLNDPANGFGKINMTAQ